MSVGILEILPSITCKNANNDKFASTGGLHISENSKIIFFFILHPSPYFGGGSTQIWY